MHEPISYIHIQPFMYELNLCTYMKSPIFLSIYVTKLISKAIIFSSLAFPCTPHPLKLTSILVYLRILTLGVCVFLSFTVLFVV